VHAIDLSDSGIRVESSERIELHTEVFIRAERYGLTGTTAVRHSSRRGSKYVLFVDDRGDPDQRRLLEAIFLGQLGGTPEQQFPWVFKPSRLIATRVAPIELDHAERRGWFRAGEEVTVRVGEPVTGQEPVTCVIPGHHRSGHELHSDSIEVDADGDALGFRFEEVCAYWSTFSYSSDHWAATATSTPPLPA